MLRAGTAAYNVKHAALRFVVSFSLFRTYAY